MEQREGEVDGKMKKVVTEFDEVEEERNVAWILDLVCRNESIARGVENICGSFHHYTTNTFLHSLQIDA